MKNIKLNDIADYVHGILTDIRNWLDISANQIENAFESFIDFIDELLVFCIDYLTCFVAGLNSWFQSFKKPSSEFTSPVKSNNMLIAKEHASDVNMSSSQVNDLEKDDLSSIKNVTSVGDSLSTDHDAFLEDNEAFFLDEGDNCTIS